MICLATIGKWKKKGLVVLVVKIKKVRNWDREVHLIAKNPLLRVGFCIIANYFKIKRIN